ncbi:alpha/beta-hydrolase [Gonapodya prolifera JEL478]|uniref:Alpha/beta-hydrolase n=1 Tax=Gonapodya prolifera (strain JEL478) TaxID=1344416 RepID=A0A139AQZ2_GONPJ|nr:alpha/beta-hydrolase [Gonapodya prolifera JEL478]|eukprot:KXS19132.1 alpha/beta-hydrolase [Gonapodya prolifera JEL478]
MSFLGVPYALPPLGSLRWKPPQPLSPDHWFQDDSEASPAPGGGYVDRTHSDGIFDGKVRRGIEQSDWTNNVEDILYVNVWSPWLRRIAPVKNLRKSRGVPVILYLHVFSTNVQHPFISPIDPPSLVSSQDIVLVEAHVRFGSFSRCPPETKDGSEWNLALLDMQAALEWVIENAEAFGGDPSRLVIASAGEGAAAVSLLSLLPLPASTESFTDGRNPRLLRINCVDVPVQTLDDAHQDWDSMLTALGGTAPSSSALLAYDKSRTRPCFRPVLAPPLPPSPINGGHGAHPAEMMVVNETFNPLGSLKTLPAKEKERAEQLIGKLVEFAWADAHQKRSSL